MKNFTFVNKINRLIVITVTAKDFETAQALIFGIGLDLEDWDF